MLFSESFIISDLTFRSLTPFEFICVCGVGKCSNFTCSCPIFPAPLIEETVYSPLCILVSFVKDKMCIGVWVYLLAFYLVPLVYIYVFVPMPYFLDD